MVQVRPLGNARLRAFQTVVVLDSNGANVLVDAGWDERLTPSVLDALVAEIPRLDAVLLTHASIAHTGAFCYLRHRYPEFRAVPAYATLPVIRMSQMMTLDVYRAAGMCGAFEEGHTAANAEKVTLSTKEVEHIWAEVHSVRYSQPLHLHFNTRIEGTVITAYNAGHTLGGSLWKVADGIDNIVVALDWNHARDAHLSGAFLEPKTGTVVPDLQRPSLLITSTDVNAGQPLTKARQRLLEELEAAVRRGGTVLVPTSAASRVLELMLVLDKHAASGAFDVAAAGAASRGEVGESASAALEHAKGTRVPLIYFSFHGKQTMTQASSMLEWMVPSIISDWQLANQSPFDTRNIHHVADLDSLRRRWPSGPRIVLADGPALESGPSREVFLRLVADDRRSSVVFTEICPPDTLGRELLDMASKASNRASDKASDKTPAAAAVTAAGGAANISATALDTRLPEVELNLRELLAGAALKRFEERQRELRRSATEEVEQTRRNRELIEASAADEAAEEEEEEQEVEEEEVTTAEGPAVLLAGSHDYIVPRGARGTDAMFPFVVKRRRVDDYGMFPPVELFRKERKSERLAREKSKAAQAALEAQEALKKKKKQAAQAEVARELRAGTDLPVQGTRGLEDDEEMDDFLAAPSLWDAAEDERPARLVRERLRDVAVRCWAAYADMNGLTNLRSLQMVLKQVQPAKIVALPGSPAVAETLAQGYVHFALADRPVAFDRTDFSVDVRVDPGMRLRWHSLSGGYAVARVRGRLEFDPHDQAKRLGATLVAADDQPRPVSRPTLVGDLKLTSLRKALMEAGMKAEFRGQGVLVCNDSVLVRQEPGGRYLLEGGVDADYYAVRAAVRRFVTAL